MIIDNKLLDELTAKAKELPRLRMNFDMRNSAEDGSRRMLNAIEPGTMITSISIVKNEAFGTPDYRIVESLLYMVDMNSGNLVPVCMKDTSLEYKTYINNGRKLVNYTLQWSESQKKLRR